MMLILEIAVFLAALAAVALLTLQQVVTQVKEYLFYKGNGWDFSADSGLDRIDEKITSYRLGLSNWQRFYLFRPFYILMLVWFMGMMVVMSF